MKVKITLTLLIILLLTACSSSDTAKEAEVVITVPPRKEPISTTTPLTYTPSIEASPCPFVLPEGFTEGGNVDCGYLIVPEDRSNPDSPEIQLAVAVFHRLNPDSSENPVVYIEGGPGASALEPLQYTISKFIPLLQAHDVIFYDQRGVGFSRPSLECPEQDTFIKDSLTKQLRPNESLPDLQQALIQCHQRLVEEGIQLEMYNTLQSAADLRDLRLALGVESWNLYSLSYGTRVALETARQHPEGIRSIILDSVVPPEADPIAEAPGNVSNALETFFDACRNDPECEAAFPDLENQFYALVNALDEQPATIPVANLLTGESYNAIVDGEVFLGVVIQSLYSAEIIPIIPLMITETAQGNFSKLSSLRSSLLTSAGFLTQGVYYTVRCHDEIPFTNPDKVNDSLNRYPQLKEFFSSSAGNGEYAFTLCSKWDSGTASADQNTPVTSIIPALVLGGQFDPSTPVYWSRQAADNLTNSFFFEFPAAGHGPSFSHPCPSTIALAFLADPSTKPESSCIAEMEIAFMLPAKFAALDFVPAEVPDAGIKSLVPNGWIQIKPEYYIAPDQSVELVISKNTAESIENFLSKWGAGEILDIPTGNEINWEVYPIHPKQNVGGWLAISETDDGFYFILIVGAESLQDTLYQNVFLPVLQAFEKA